MSVLLRVFSARCSSALSGLSGTKKLTLHRMMSSMQDQFKNAQEKLNSLKNEPDNDVKLKVYALFKQSTAGNVTTERPGVMDFVGRAKWDAWNSLGDMSQEDAQKAYINLINELAGTERKEVKTKEQSSEVTSDQKYKNFLISTNDGLRVITFNKPEKYNAFSYEMFQEMTEILIEAADDSETVITALTGAGDFYSAGNDISNQNLIPKTGIKEFLDTAASDIHRLMDLFIDFKKPLIAVVNGPAIGVACTTLALCDVVYTSDRAWFWTPFTKLGVNPEGCSSYTFPAMLGKIAGDLLLFNRKMTAAEAHQAGLVTRIFPHDSFQETVWPLVQSYAKLPRQSLMHGKELYRGPLRNALKEANRREIDRLRERWESDEAMNAAAVFLRNKDQ